MTNRTRHPSSVVFDDVTEADTSPAGVIKRVESILAEFLDDRARVLALLGADLDPLMRAAHTCVLAGGKRLRPIFAYLAWQTAAPQDADDEAMVTAAASLELLHACALVHDDVMDSSATRRGRPSAYTVFEQLHRARGFTGQREAFGRSAAIVLGDLLLSWADRLFANAGLEPRAARRARGVYDDMREQVMAGQYLDVLVQARGGFSADDALRVIEYKTSKYTIEGPLLFGAAIGGASDELTAALSSYGLPLGEAFQLRDDLLGVFGDPGRTGKPAGDDLREGKRTLLIAITMHRADHTQADLIRRRLGDRDLDDTGLAALRQLIVDAGAVAEVESRIATCTARARAALASPAIRADVREVLDGLAVAAAERQT